MEMKRIVAPDVRSALRLVREQLGPDAMIMSNRRVAEGVEILAAAAGAVQHQTSPASRLHEAAPSAPAPAPGPLRAQVAPAAPEFADVQSELRSMRSFLESRLAELRSDQLQFGPGIEGRAWRRLTRLGLPNELVRELVRGIDTQAGWTRAWRSVVGELIRGIAESGDVLAAEGVYAFVGPTGAGKSTTLCKLAVRHALEHGPEGLVLISMDGMRLGGCDMLRAVARLLNVPFHAALEGESLAELLARAPGAKRVLVDTSGVNRRIARHMEQLRELGTLADSVRTLLVLPANAQMSWLDSAFADYRAAAPRAIVVTKLDETRSLGEVLGLLVRERLPLCYSTDGPEIPEDLAVATATALVERALQLDPESEAEDRAGPAAGSYAALPGIGARIAQ